MPGRFQKSQTDAGFAALLTDSIRWPYQQSLTFPEACRQPAKVDVRRKPRGDLEIYSMKMGVHVRCESRAEVTFCEHLDRGKEILHFFEQPPPVYYQFGGTTRPYYPDFMFSYVDGRTVLVEVKQDRDLLTYKNVAKWAALAMYCERKGFGFYIGDSHDSYYQLLHAPVSAALIHDLLSDAKGRSLDWQDVQSLKRSNRANQRHLLSALCQSGLLVTDDFRVRKPTHGEARVLDRFRAWMVDVNERPTAQHPTPPVQIRHRTAVDPHDEHHLSNAGKPWSRKDEKRLVEAFKSTQDVPYVARLLQRTPNAIRIRLERLEISERPDRLRATPYS